MKWHRLFSICVTICVVALFGLNAQFLIGQTGSGVVIGTVHDPSGAVIPKAKVVLTNIGTGVTFTTETTSAGAYTFPDVAVGTYTVTASASGFQQTISNNVVVALSKTDTVDVQLQVGAATSTVQVQAATVQLDTSSSQNSTTIDQETYDNLPFGMNGGARSVTQIAEVMPGVSENDGAGYSSPGTTSDQNWAETISGGQQFGGALMMYDGVPLVVINQGSLGLVTQPVPVEALGEFSLVQNNFNPEYGQTPGGVMAFSTRAGTNAYHGQAYEYLRNNDLDAAGYFAPGPGAAPNKLNEFGINVGGPVSIPHLFSGHDRLFFFGYYSGFRLASLSPYTGETIPTLAEQGGDFSALGVPIYDPTTQVCDNSGVCTRQQYDYNGNPNVIPPSEISNASKVWTSYLPTPQNSNAINYFATGPNNETMNRYGGRIDYHFRENDQIYGFFANAPYTIENYVNAFLPGMAPYGGNLSSNVSSLVRLGWDHTFTPSVLLHLAGGWNRQTSNSTPPYNTNFIDYGIPNELPNVTPSIYYLTGNYADNGGSGGSFGKEHAYVYNGFLSWTKGRHQFKFGGMFWEGRSFGHSNSSMVYRLLAVETNSANTNNPTLLANSGDPYASFEAGYFDSYQGSLSPFPMDPQYMLADAYFNDDLKLTSRLTLNLGLRYEIPWTVHVKNNIYSTFEPNVANPGAGGLPGAMVFQGTGQYTCECARFSSTLYSLWQPRIGFAYKVDENTVLRGGYGIYTGQAGAVGQNGGGADGFNISVQNASANAGITPGMTVTSGLVPYAQPPFIDPTVDNGISPNWDRREDGNPGVISNYMLSAERQLPHGFVMQLAYVGNSAQHISSGLDMPNQLPISILQQYSSATLSAAIDSPAGIASGVLPPFPNFVSVMGGNATVAQALKAFPMYVNVTRQTENAGHTSYNALEAEVQRSFRNGFSTLISYTWAKQMTNAESFIGAFNDYAQDTYGRQGEYVAAYDQAPQVLNLTYVYNLPFGYNRRFLNHGLMASLIGGWGVSGIQRYETGAPMYQLGENNPLPIGNRNYRPNFVPGQPMRASWSGKFNPKLDPQLNVNAFTAPPANTFGNVPKNLSLRTFGWYDEALGARKEFHIWEATSFQFGVDFFNAFNRSNFDNINGNTGNPGPGNPNFGFFGIQGNSPRSIQFNAKVKF